MAKWIILLLALVLAACSPDGARLQPSSMEIAVGQTVTLDAVRSSIVPDPLAADVVIRPAVCFVASDWALFAKPFEISGVLVTWPQNLVERIAAAGSLTATGVARIANRIGVALPAAGRS